MDIEGFEPSASRMQNGRSTTELNAPDKCPSRRRTWGTFCSSFLSVFFQELQQALKLTLSFKTNARLAQR